MRPLLISSSEIEGGAARATVRAHRGLRASGVDSRMLVMRRQSHDRAVLGPQSGLEQAWARLAPYLDRLPVRARSLRPSSAFSTQWFPNPISARAAHLGADILHLNWVADGFVPVSRVGTWRLPIVWTLHDMWPLTGGCHYDEGCGRFRDHCGRCPVLGSTRERDLSRVILDRKRRHWGSAEATVVAPSRWMAACARESIVFRDRRIEVIPYGVPLDRFRPIDRRVARDLLGLPQDRPLVAFGAVASTDDPRKGYAPLMAALREVSALAPLNMELIVFGAEAPAIPDTSGIPTWFLGHLHDDISLALAYAASDAFVAPSRQDNLPNTVLEAMACGIPTVAFDLGGMPDLIEHQRTGYLARPHDVSDLAHGIRLLLESQALAATLGRQARAKAEAEFAMERQASSLASLYADILELNRVRN